MADKNHKQLDITEEEATARLEKAELATDLCAVIAGKTVSQVLDCLAMIVARVLQMVFAESRPAFGVLGFSFLGRLFHYVDDNPLKEMDLGLLPDKQRTH